MYALYVLYDILHRLKMTQMTNESCFWRRVQCKAWVGGFRLVFADTNLSNTMAKPDTPAASHIDQKSKSTIKTLSA